MSTLYLTEPRSTLRRQSECLRVTRDTKDEQGQRGQQVLGHVTVHDLELVVLCGDVHITADATRLCLAQGIAVAWLSSAGRLLGRIVPAQSRSADLRLAQYRAAIDDAARLTLARSFASAKMRNAAQTLRRAFHHDPRHHCMHAACDRLLQLAQHAEAAERIDSLLGVEGSAARCYFETFGAAFHADFPFTGRVQHPSPDPANAALSLGYVLLSNRLAGLLEAHGLDPALGFLHDIRPGRPSLALDLLEEFRHPVVDRFVLRAANLRMLRTDLFQPDADHVGGVRLTRDGQRLFFPAWEKFLHRPLLDAHESQPLSTIQLLQRQIERLAAHLRGRATYCSFQSGRPRHARPPRVRHLLRHLEPPPTNPSCENP